MTTLAIVAARRTPFGRFRGKLAALSPVDLAVAAGRAALEGLDPAAIDQVILGNVLAAGHGMNIARQVGMGLGLRLETPAYTINMMCASGLQAVLLAAQAIRAGDARAVLCGGTESMSQSPLLVERPASGESATVEHAVDSMQRDGLVDTFSGRSMADTVEDLASELGISRGAQDAFALRSQQRYAAALAADRFRDEIVPVAGLDTDEHPRPQVTLKSLSELKPFVRPTGSITAGTSSGVNDGAAILVLADADWARARGWPVLAELELGVAVGCEPVRMGLGPVAAVRSILQQLHAKLTEFDTVELNEAFAAQALACLKELGATADGSPVFNPDGGAIAIGHPIGASGARVLAHLVWRIARGESQRAIATLCVGGGMGIAVALRRPA